MTKMYSAILCDSTATLWLHTLVALLKNRKGAARITSTIVWPFSNITTEEWFYIQVAIYIHSLLVPLLQHCKNYICYCVFPLSVLHLSLTVYTVDRIINLLMYAYHFKWKNDLIIGMIKSVYFVTIKPQVAFSRHQLNDHL